MSPEIPWGGFAKGEHRLHHVTSPTHLTSIIRALLVGTGAQNFSTYSFFIRYHQEEVNLGESWLAFL